MSKTRTPVWRQIDPDQEAALWAARHSDWTSAKQQLAAHYLPFAKMLAAQLYAKRVGDEIEFNDYLQISSMGLLEAIERYDTSGGASFRTYAEYRINGSLHNALASYTERQQQNATQRRVRERIASLSENSEPHSKARKAFDDLAAIAVGMALGMLFEEEGLYVGEEEQATAMPAYSSQELKQLRQRLMQLLDRLPKTEAMVIRYHYLQQIEFSEIASLMGVTKGRISQLHKQALERLRMEVRNLDLRNMAW